MKYSLIVMVCLWLLAACVTDSKSENFDPSIEAPGYNDDIQSAQKLSTRKSLEGSLNASSDPEDYYQFTLTQSEIITINCDFRTEEDGINRCELFDEELNKINYFVGEEFYFEFNKVLDAGKYYLKISTDEGEADYHLIISTYLSKNDDIDDESILYLSTNNDTCLQVESASRQENLEFADKFLNIGIDYFALGTCRGDYAKECLMASRNAADALIKLFFTDEISQEKMAELCHVLPGAPEFLGLN